LEDYVIETVSRLYVPMVRKELWTDDPETLNRRLAIYATLWHVLKTLTLLFNPVTPYLCEALHQKIYRKLDDTLHETVNMETWPEPNNNLRDKKLEEDFQALFKTVSLVFAARQSAKLKRRWPLSKMIVSADKKTCDALKGEEELFLELSNVKKAEYDRKTPEDVEKRWISATENGTSVFLDTTRDDRLLGEGLMRDLARRIQTLRKELGYVPTDVLATVHVANLDVESVALLKPYEDEMKELVRAKHVNLAASREETEAKWHEYAVDDQKVYLAISGKAEPTKRREKQAKN
jgi:valyl-tRNA synthetase